MSKNTVTKKLPQKNETQNNDDSDDSQYFQTEFDQKDFVRYILNEKNKLITKKDVESILRKYNIKLKINNLDTFQQAMVHTSYLKKTSLNDKTAKLLKDVQPIDNPSDALPLMDKSYETLEFIGDAVIHCILAQYLYKRYRDKDEGFLTKLRTKIEKGTTLCQISRKIGLHEFAIFARNIELSGGRMNNKNIMEDIFEAFIGALSLETSYENCKLFVENLIDEELDLSEMINTEDNYKEMLMQYYHKTGNKDTPPRYDELETIEDGIRRKFKMCVKDPNNKIVGVGVGTSKKIGAQEAAKNALIFYGVLKKNNVDVVKDDDGYFGEIKESDDDGYFGEFNSDDETITEDKNKSNKKK